MERGARRALGRGCGPRRASARRARHDDPSDVPRCRAEALPDNGERIEHRKAHRACSNLPRRTNGAPPCLAVVYIHQLAHDRPSARSLRDGREPTPSWSGPRRTAPGAYGASSGFVESASSANDGCSDAGDPRQRLEHRDAMMPSRSCAATDSRSNALAILARGPSPRRDEGETRPCASTRASTVEHRLANRLVQRKTAFARRPWRASPTRAR